MASSRKLPATSSAERAVVEAVGACLGRWLKPAQCLTVGLSGGMDSVVLLHALRRSPLAVSAVHVHHGLSPNADAWQEFCQDLCAAWDVPLRVERVVVPRSPEGIEGAARRVRRAVYESHSADWVALGHHRGDQAETVMLQLLRGSGVRGAAAMAERSGKILRPLLTLGRSTIADYAAAHDLSWVEDESNADTRFSRNFLRHRILTELARRFPAAEEQLAAAARRFADAQSLLDELAVGDLSGQGKDFPVQVAWLGTLTEARARNVLRYLLARRGIGVPSEERLVEALRQFLSAAPDRHPAVVIGAWRLLRRRGWIELELREQC